jgi:hypothetical protein
VPEVLEIMMSIGVPDILQFDNGRELMNAASKSLDFETVSGRARNPQAQGSVERGNYFLCQRLAVIMKALDTRKWWSVLPIAKMLVNSSKHRGIGMEPHQYVFGRPLLQGNHIDLKVLGPQESLSDLNQRIRYSS